MAAKTKSTPKNRVAGLENGAPRASSGVKRVRVKIRGLAPGLMFQGKGLMEADEGNTKQTKPRPPEEEARLRAHWMGRGANKQLCIPWIMIFNSICSAAGMFKFRGSTKMGSVVAATIACEVDKISLGTADFETYEAYCRIPPGKGGAMVKIGRPLIRNWECEFVMIVDDERYPVESLHEIITYAGKLIGIGAWRPQLKGPHGRFEVVEFEII